MTLKEWLIAAKRQLMSVSDSSQLDAEVLLSDCLQVNKSYLYTWPEKTLSATQLQQLQEWLTLRLQGCPIAYIVGHREFWSLDFKVTPATLIPRPETELIVEICLQQLSDAQQYILELGTGSGAIAIALAHERPQWHILASDNSSDALAVAEYNARQLAVSNIQFSQNDWFDNIAAQQFAAIISNPPYIAKDDPHLQQGDVKFEPLVALVAEKEGIAALDTIIKNAPQYLASQGLLVLEHGYQQASQVRQQMEQCGFEKVLSYRDLAGHERVTVGCLVK